MHYINSRYIYVSPPNPGGRLERNNARVFKYGLCHHQSLTAGNSVDPMTTIPVLAPRLLVDREASKETIGSDEPMHKGMQNVQPKFSKGPNNANASKIPSRLLGAFSLTLLAVLKQRGEGISGADLQRELSQRSGRQVAIGQLYLTLQRLADHGLISFETTDPERVQGGRRKKLFKLEASGERALDNITA